MARRVITKRAKTLTLTYRDVQQQYSAVLELLKDAPMRLDVVIATYRRPIFLRKTLESIRAAHIPTDVAVHVVVVDNDSDVSDCSAIEELGRGAPFRLTVVREPAAGKSNALNTGIRVGSAEYVAFIDDDEEIDASWFSVVAATLAGGGLDFIGGRTLPLWRESAPVWIPDEFRAVLGIVDSGRDPQPYGHAFPGMLTGGNAVIARTMLNHVGLFSPRLGPRQDRRLFSCEDEDLYWRLIDAGARGLYVPDLVVYHHVHAERLTKRYHRAWCFWNGVSKAVLRRDRPQPVRHVAGVPRYLYGAGLRGAWGVAAATVLRRPARSRFRAELAVWDLCGYFYGRHFYRARAGRDDVPAVKIRPAKAVERPVAAAL
jgi:glucosyl-dolichyl phosphate glucuronosyltransferase